MIYQLHPDHGRHIAYSPQEATSNIKNGWETVTKEQFYDVPRETPTETKGTEGNSLRDTLVELYIEKFGEKPHHRMSETTIQAKLDE